MPAKPRHKKSQDPEFSVLIILWREIRFALFNPNISYISILKPHVRQHAKNQSCFIHKPARLAVTYQKCQAEELFIQELSRLLQKLG